MTGATDACLVPNVAPRRTPPPRLHRRARPGRRRHARERVRYRHELHIEDELRPRRDDRWPPELSVRQLVGDDEAPPAADPHPLEPGVPPGDDAPSALGERERWARLAVRH